MKRTITLRQVLSLDPCYEKNQPGRCKMLFADRRKLSVQDILALTIPEKDKLWVLVSRFFLNNRYEQVRFSFHCLDLVFRHIRAEFLKGSIYQQVFFMRRITEAREEIRHWLTIPKNKNWSLEQYLEEVDDIIDKMGMYNSRTPRSNCIQSLHILSMVFGVWGGDDSENRYDTVYKICEFIHDISPDNTVEALRFFDNTYQYKYKIQGHRFRRQG